MTPSRLYVQRLRLTPGTQRHTRAASSPMSGLVLGDDTKPMVRIPSNSMKVSVVVDDARLVKEIRKHDALYDSRKRGNKDLPEKGQAWSAVSAALGIPALDAKNRWRNLRDRFVREKKRLLNDGEKVYGLRDPWPLLEDMAFLWAFITHRNQPGSGDPPKKKSKKGPELTARPLQPILPRPSPEWVNVAAEYDSQETPRSPVQPPNDSQCVIVDDNMKEVKQETFDDSESGSQLRRLLVDGHGTETDEELQVSLQNDMEDLKPSQIRDIPKDEDELFCLSVAASFKRFTPKMKAQAKWKIQQVLYDVEFNQPGASTSDRE